MSIVTPAPTSPSPSHGRGLGVRGYSLLGLAIVAALAGSVGVWAATTEIAGAVVAPATVVVDSNVKKVQHPTGGVIAEIAVRDGDTVKAGELLLRLDETVLRANLNLIVRQFDEIAVRQARLRAELSGAVSVAYPSEQLARRSEPHMGEILTTETSLFESRRDGRNGLKRQYEKRIGQLGDEIKGLEAELRATSREYELAAKELKGLELLEGRDLINVTKITAARRLVAQIDGDVHQVAAKIAQSGGKIAETELQILQLDQDMKSEAGKELREQQAKGAELAERRIAAEDQLRRVEVRAPQDGVVHQLSVHTVGGVVTPSEPVMLIVPDADRLVLEAKIAPQDIDQINVGQHARVRLSAFNQRTTPELDAVVMRLSADLTIEGQTRSAPGQSGAPVGAATYYVARIALTDDAKAAIANHKLIPGMPAEVHVKTGDRTAMSYLMKPLSDQFERAFRER